MSKRWRKGGKRVRNPAGKRTRVEECCCGGRHPCSNCDGGTMPEVATVTIAGFSNSPWTLLNDTFVLDGHETNCTYEFQDSGTGPCTANGYDLCIFVAVGVGIIRVSVLAEVIAT